MKTIGYFPPPRYEPDEHSVEIQSIETDREWTQSRVPASDPAIAEAITEMVTKRMAFIDANKERLVEAWIAETGLLPSESLMVIQDGPRELGDQMWTMRVHIERRQPRETPCPTASPTSKAEQG